MSGLAQTALGFHHTELRSTRIVTPVPDVMLRRYTPCHAIDSVNILPSALKLPTFDCAKN